MEAFETWLLHRVAYAVEAGEVSADLLAELRTELERARELSQGAGPALTVRDIADRLQKPSRYNSSRSKTCSLFKARPRSSVGGGFFAC